MGSPVAAPWSIQDYGQTLLTTCRSRCGSNGLVIQPVAPAARPCCLSVGIAGRQEQDRRALELGLGAQGLDELQAVHVGHVEIGDDDVDLIVRQHLQGIDPVIGLDDMEAGVAQGHGDHLAHGPGIIDGQYSLAHRAFPSTEWRTFRRHAACRGRRGVWVPSIKRRFRWLVRSCSNLTQYLSIGSYGVRNAAPIDADNNSRYRLPSAYPRPCSGPCCAANKARAVPP